MYIKVQFKTLIIFEKSKDFFVFNYLNKLNYDELFFSYKESN